MEHYMDDFETYKRFTAHCTCTCYRHCNTECMTDDCDCKNCNCVTCEDTRLEKQNKDK